MKKLTNAQVRTALQGSIEKWKAIVAGTGVDEGTENCPLCLMFWHRYCHGCPIQVHVGRSGCHNTPYDKWDCLTGWISPTKAYTPEEVKAANDMLKFLRMLDRKFFVKGVTV